MKNKPICKEHAISQLGLELGMKSSEYAIKGWLSHKEIEQVIKRVYETWITMGKCIKPIKK